MAARHPEQPVMDVLLVGMEDRAAPACAPHHGQGRIEGTRGTGGLQPIRMGL
jgi:hypothetical protein